jgi:hypothetical protein
MAWLRTLLIVLVLLNVLAFAGLQGWLGTPTQQGEPERLTNQLNPERIKLRPAAKPRKAEPAPAAKVAPQPAPAAAPVTPPAAAAIETSPSGGNGAEQTCLAFSGLGADAAGRLAGEAASEQGVVAKDVQVEAPTSWWVNIPPAESREAAEARAAELRQQGVTDLFIVQEAGANQFAVSLGLFKQAAQAERLLGQLQGQGVGGARVTPRGAVHRVEMRGPAGRLPELAAELARRFPGVSQHACPP